MSTELPLNGDWQRMEQKKRFTQWCPFDESTGYFQPSQKEFMINYRVENLEALVEELKKMALQ